MLGEELRGDNNLGNLEKKEEKEEVVVCMGGDWYTFPSHFFLPKNVRLEYIRGTFHGQLPQHFSKFLGTSAVPFQDFNDQNKEENSRYVSLNKCDYIVLNIDDDNEYYEFDEINKSNDNEEDNEINNFDENKIESNQEMTASDMFQIFLGMKNEVIPNENEKKEKRIFKFKSRGTENENENENEYENENNSKFYFFTEYFSTSIIDPVRSTSALTRAYFIPGLSNRKNKYRSYSVLKAQS